MLAKENVLSVPRNVSSRTSPPRAASSSPVLVLHGPMAGRGQSRDELDRLQRLMRSCGREAIVTSDCDRVKKSLRDDPASVLVAAGGDGTLSLAARIAMPTDSVVLPMPMGTENLLARRMGYRADADAVGGAILRNHVEPVDAMAVDVGGRQQISLVMATAGFDASVVRRVHLRRRGHIRRWTYAAPIVQTMIDYPFGEIVVNAEGHDPIRCRWAMVFNVAAYAANLPIAPRAMPNDGLLDVICFQGRSVIDGLRYLAGVMTSRHDRFNDVTSIQTAAVSMSADQRIAIQCDGDYVGRLPATIRCLPGAVRMLAPAADADAGFDKPRG